jgi:hypothetical protein
MSSENTVEPGTDEMLVEVGMDFLFRESRLLPRTNGAKKSPTRRVAQRKAPKRREHIIPSSQECYKLQL